eukprot:scaffold113658_cov47-Phaeocystis_antarctica.AAC.1
MPPFVQTSVTFVTLASLLVPFANGHIRSLPRLWHPMEVEAMEVAPAAEAVEVEVEAVEVEVE